jgi:hypothetical protein
MQKLNKNKHEKLTKDKKTRERCQEDSGIWILQILVTLD